MQLPTQPSDSTMDNLRVYIRTQVRHCEDLPAIPRSVKTVTALLGDINSSLDEIEASIVSDPCSAIRLIQMANSAFYGSHQVVMSIRRAILLLGFDALKLLFSNVPLHDSFVRKNTSEIQVIDSISLHSLAVARLSQRIAKDVRQRVIEPDDAFCAGLLHDIGRSVLLHLFAKDYYQLLSRVDNDPERDLFQAETQTFEVTHTEVGRWFAEAWHLPVPIVQTMAMHHHLSTENRLVMIVQLADYIVSKERIGLVDGHDRTRNPGPLLRGLDLSTEQLKQYGRFIQSESDTWQLLKHHAA